MERLPLLQAVRIYWLNLLAAFLTPVLTLVLARLFMPLGPVAFFSLLIFAGIPYRLGKAPVSYLITCQVAFALGGVFVGLIIWSLLAAGVPEELLNKGIAGQR